MAGPKSTESKAAVKDEPGGKKAQEAQEKAAKPESKVSQQDESGTPQDAKAVGNKDKAEAQHPEQAPDSESGGPKPVDKDAPKPKEVDTENEPESTEDRFQQEAQPVGLPDSAATDSETVPLDPPADASARNSNAPIAAAQAAIGDGSLNDIAVGVGLRSVNGERTGGLVDEDGQPIENFEDVLDMGDGTRTNVTVTKRVYESFLLPGSQRPLTRLLYADGATLSREQARAVSEAAKA